MTLLEPMSEVDFGRFLERAIPRRAARYVSRGVWTEAHALEASREFYSRLLPQGLATPNHHFCHVLDEPGKARVGEVWYTAANEGGVVQFWIEWIWIEPECRRRGFAIQALRLLEEEARQRGAARIGLDVWRDNPGAIKLYEKLGYSSVSMSMVKSLERVGGNGRESRAGLDAEPR